MRIPTKAAALGVLLFALFPAVAAHAADSCTGVPYCNPDTPHFPNTPNSPPGDTPSGDVQPSEAVQGGAPAGAPGAVESSPAVSPAPMAATAPSGSLPFTGGDVVGMTLIGAGALGIGTVMVRRSKKAKSEA